MWDGACRRRHGLLSLKQLVMNGILLPLVLQTSFFVGHVSSETIPLQLVLDATSEEVHYIKGYLTTPSFMDLSEMKFVTSKQPSFDREDDDLYNDDDEIYNEDDDDDFEEEETPPPDDEEGNENTEIPTQSDTSEPTEGSSSAGDGDEGSGTDAPEGEGGDEGAEAPEGEGGGDEGTNAPGDGGNRTRILEEGGKEGGSISQRTTQILDFIVFRLPTDCKKTEWGSCIWAALGVGAYDDEVEGGVSFCCSEDTVAREICNAEDLGRMIVDHTIFQGDHRTVSVPTEDDQEFVLDDAVFHQSISGDYIMILGNCDDYGMDVLAVGSMEWKSGNCNLPGELYSLMWFYDGLTLIYLLLVVCYGCGMRMYQEAAIPIQKYIAATMVLGLLELFFRSLDLHAWCASGVREESITYISLTLGVLKRGISRCLGVMVAMGWGVVRDSLGSTLAQIIFLGLLYSGLTLFRDIFVVVAEEKVNTLSTSAEDELVDFALLLTPIIIVINLIFYFWILRSLNATTEYLQNMNQTSKLQRHSRLRCIFIISLVVAAGWLIFTIYDVFTDVLTTDQTWVLEAVMQLNYLFLLAGVAFLWRPNANAKDYAMQMELPAFGEDDANELELSCVVPSAGDMDDGNDPDHPNGLKLNGAVLS